nr:MAG TPA: hypothetical protein [Caudoviricetes sp.]
MNEFFVRLLSTLAAFGEIRDAHLYNYNYACATVKNGGREYEITVNITEDEEE